VKKRTRLWIEHSRRVGPAPRRIRELYGRAALLLLAGLTALAACREEPELAGAATEAARDETSSARIETTSLRPPLSGDAADLSLTAYGDSLQLHNIFGVAPLRFVREGRWKYIHKVNPELYDVEIDPREGSNLASREPARVADLQKKLHALLSDAVGRPDARYAIDAETSANLAALGHAAAAFFSRSSGVPVSATVSPCSTRVSISKIRSSQPLGCSCRSSW